MTSQYILYLFAKDTNLHHSCNFSTSPLPELQIRSVVQHAYK